MIDPQQAIKASAQRMAQQIVAMSRQEYDALAELFGRDMTEQEENDWGRHLKFYSILGAAFGEENICPSKQASA